MFRLNVTCAQQKKKYFETLCLSCTLWILVTVYVRLKQSSLFLPLNNCNLTSADKYKKRSIQHSNDYGFTQISTYWHNVTYLCYHKKKFRFTSESCVFVSITIFWKTNNWHPVILHPDTSKQDPRWTVALGFSTGNIKSASTLLTCKVWALAAVFTKVSSLLRHKVDDFNLPHTKHNFKCSQIAFRWVSQAGLWQSHDASRHVTFK